MKSKQSSHMALNTEAKDQSQFLSTIAVHLSTLLKIIIYTLLLLAIFFVFIKIYTPQGIVILPFEIKNENLSGIAIADQITSELLRIQRIHSIKYKSEILSKNQTNFMAALSADLSPSDLVPKTEFMEFSMADTGTISTGLGSLDPGKLIIAFKNICPASKPGTIIRGSLQRYGSNIVLVAVLEGDNVQSWMVRQPIDNNNEDHLHEMISNLTFMIAHDLPRSDVSAKTWDGLKYYTEALDAYNQYNLTGNLDAINKSVNYSLKAIFTEKGYRKPYDLLRTLEFEYISIEMQSNAIEICNKTIDLNPSSEYGWENKANVLHLLKKYSEALQAYDKATTLNSQYAEAWNDKGSVLKDLAKYDEAIRAHDEAIRINPKYANAWNNKGLVFDAQGEYDEAVNAYDKAIKINPNHANAWNNKGFALDAQGEYDEAISAYDEAIRLNPKYADAWNNKGYALEAHGKHDEAIKASNKAIELDPNHADGAWRNKGDALSSLGKYDEAIKSYDEAIRLDKDYAKAWNNKGIALKSLGRTTEAEAAIDKAKELGYTG